MEVVIYRTAWRSEQIFLEMAKQNIFMALLQEKCQHIRHSAEDMLYDPKRNSIWINSGDGLLEFSLHDKQFRKIDALNELIKIKRYDRDVGIDIDKNGRIWFATLSNGIFIYDPKTERCPASSFQILICKKKQEKLIFIFIVTGMELYGLPTGMNYGIYEFLPFNPPFKRFTANPKMKDSLSNHVIYTIIPAAQW